MVLKEPPSSQNQNIELPRSRASYSEEDGSGGGEDVRRLRNLRD